MRELPLIKKPPIKVIDLVKYSGASGDFNEIHTVQSVANEKGYPDVIAHGMFLMGWCAEAIQEWFPNRKLRVFTVRFQSIVLPGVELIINGHWQEDGIDRGEIELSDIEGEIKLQGYFELE